MPNKSLESLPVATRCLHCPVRSMALFQGVPQAYLDDAQKRRTGQFRLRARRHLYEEGAEAQHAYTLFDGWLLLYRAHSDGSRQGLRVALPGDFVGYAPPGTRSASHSALAVGDAVVCGFRQEDLHEMLHTHPVILHQIIALQSRDSASCQAAMLGLGRKSAAQRIAYLLMELYCRMELRDGVNSEDGSMVFPLTQEMIGDLTGLTPVHTNRVLRKMRNDKILTLERHRLHIHDRDALARLGEFPGWDEKPGALPAYP